LAARLIEINRLAWIDAELLPIDDGFVAGLVDIDRIRTMIDAGLSSNDLPPEGLACAPPDSTDPIRTASVLSAGTACARWPRWR